MKTVRTIMGTIMSVRRIGMGWLAGIFVLTGAAACLAEAEETRHVRAFYFGNSLTGSSDPKWHQELGHSAGRQWIAEASLGAGWQLWQHRHELRNSGVALKRGAGGDLTIGPEGIGNARGRLRRFFTEKWDAVVLQPFSMGLSWKCTEMWGVDFGKEIDVGDIASAGDLIDVYLCLNPQGKVFIYQDWPAMPAGKIPPDEQLPAWALEMKKRLGRIRTAEFPDREAFDYAAAWADARYKPSPDPERFWLQENARSKDYHQRLFAALVARYPDLHKAGRLRTIPVGDVFLALHRRMKSGQFPGCRDIEDFYTDVQHLRAGLPRYAVAASFFAALFGEHPGKLDWRLYNDRSRHAQDPHHDSGEFLEITPEAAKVVNETIWEVLTTEPTAGLAGEGP